MTPARVRRSSPQNRKWLRSRAARSCSSLLSVLIHAAAISFGNAFIVAYCCCNNSSTKRIQGHDHSQSKNKSVMTIYDNHRTPKHGSIHNKLWHWMDIFRSSAKANWGGSSSTAPFGSRIHPSEAWKSPSKQKSRVQANRNQMLAPGPITIQSRSNHDPITFATSPGPITICQCQGTFFSTPLPGNTTRQTRLPHVLPMEVSIEVGDAPAVDVRHP